MSSQLQFTQMESVRAHRPLVALEALTAWCDKDSDEILALIEGGELGWAWDIRGPGADRREIRVWRDSVEAYLRGGGAGTDGTEGMNEEEVLASVFPHKREELRSPELERMFSCSQVHVYSLVRMSLIDGLNEPRLGPYGFIRVTRASVIRFLQQRRIL